MRNELKSFMSDERFKIESKVNEYAKANGLNPIHITVTETNKWYTAWVLFEKQHFE